MKSTCTVFGGERCVCEGKSKQVEASQRQRDILVCRLLWAGLGKSRQVWASIGKSRQVGTMSNPGIHGYWQLGWASLGKWATTGNPGIQGYWQLG